MTGNRILQYLGLRRAPGAERTAADGIFPAVLIVAIVSTMFLTRRLDFWPQITALVAVAVIIGVLGGAALSVLAARRGRRDTGASRSRAES